MPGGLDTLQALGNDAIEAATQAGLSRMTLDLVSGRASQTNGCTVCLDVHTRATKKAGENEERLFTLAAWQETPYFTDLGRTNLPRSWARLARPSRSS